MFELKVLDSFDAAHRIEGYPGKCARLHGHTWSIEVFVVGEILDELGMVIDFKTVRNSLREVLDEFDHQCLNDLPMFREKNPTAENIAMEIFDRMSQKIPIDRVSVWESPKSCVTYSKK